MCRPIRSRYRRPKGWCRREVLSVVPASVAVPLMRRVPPSRVRWELEALGAISVPAEAMVVVPAPPIVVLASQLSVPLR